MVRWKPDPDERHGQVFTRHWVVELILDLVGYTVESDLAAKTIVEPSCGGGAFLTPIVERLAESCRRQNKDMRDCAHAIRAFDLLKHNAERSRKDVVATLTGLGETVEVAEQLADTWVTTGDFLLLDHEPGAADFVVGNPPYIRLEDVPDEVSTAYRNACPTMRGRADVYVGFYEIALGLLRPEGRLGFICADRWMRNQYGAGLRRLVAADYAVDAVIAMHDVDAFEDEVSAYPAITILRSGSQDRARLVETNETFGEEAAVHLCKWAQTIGSSAKSSSYNAAELPSWFDGDGLWPTGSPAQLRLLAKLEERFPPLQDPDTGTRVGIGVATGCDSVYITDDTSVVEPDRLLPLLTAKDISEGSPQWSGKCLINPWNGEGLVDLDSYPRLAAYLDDHQDHLRQRHVARKQPARWYRTIDRITPGLLEQPKLLLPDMKSASHPVLDPGHYYPHHNLYYIVSEKWDLEVLGGLLLSNITNLFVGAYCVKMRGGTYRFQAQYLRKIRVPPPASISSDAQRQLRAAFAARDVSQASEIAAAVYGIDSAELASSGRNTSRASRKADS